MTLAWPGLKDLFTYSHSRKVCRIPFPRVFSCFDAIFYLLLLSKVRSPCINSFLFLKINYYH